MTNILYDALFKPHQGCSDTFLSMTDGEHISYDDFLSTANQFAAVLQDVGVGIGDRIAVMVEKTPQALAIYAASVKIGAVYLPLNTAYTATEIAYFVNDASPAVLLCDESKYAGIIDLADTAGATVMTLNRDGSGSLVDLAQGQTRQVDIVERSDDDLAAMLYTSGTTGRPKGAMLSHANLLSNSKALVDLWRFSSTDILLHALPIFHTHGLFVAMNVTLLAGSSVIFMSAFNIDTMIEKMPNATVLMGVPTFYTRLLNDQRFNQALTSHMRLFVSGSAPLLTETHELFSKRTGHYILERYGMTETNMNISNPYNGERRPGAVGFPLPGITARICHPDTGVEMAQGDIGGLEIKGPNVFKGYWNMPEKTREEFTDDGFFITGDLATADKDGYFHIVGRSKDLIISGGFNVYPKEVELCLDDVPEILESAVIGIAHKDFGEAVVAVVVLNKRAHISESEVLIQISNKLARYKQPKRIFFVDEIPRNTMGKVQKNKLRETFMN